MAHKATNGLDRSSDPNSFVDSELILDSLPLKAVN